MQETSKEEDRVCMSYSLLQSLKTVATHAIHVRFTAIHVHFTAIHVHFTAIHVRNVHLLLHFHPFWSEFSEVVLQ